jgi:glutathione S-transferase
MLTLFDFQPSRNAWKVRQLLQLLNQPYRTVSIDVLQGEGQHPSYLRINPVGKVPALMLDDSRTLTESNAILYYLAEDSPYLPVEPFDRAKVLQWMNFEQEHVESTIGTLRYWTGLGTISSQHLDEVQSRRAKATRALEILDNQLATEQFLVAGSYTIADIALSAYATCAEEVGISLAPYPHFLAWIARMAARPNFLAQPR